MAGVILEGIVKAFGDVTVIGGVDLAVEPGELVVFVGPSGCGKSTLLRLIAGLEDVTDGLIRIGERRVDGLPPARRGVAMVFQSYALYPHMSVFDNMAFGLRQGGLRRAEVRARVEEAARTLELTPLLARRPRELSGGQRQRVAIGRAIVREPEVFLFDEPLSNLDAALRVQTRLEIAKLHRRLGATMIYVTHDQVEAMTLADRIVVLNRGRVEQFGDPLELYRRPANLFVASFLGAPTMNTLAGTVEAVADRTASVRCEGALVPIELGRDVAVPSGALTLGVRPEALSLAAPADGTWTGEVDVVEALGDGHLVHVRLPGGARVTTRAPGDPRVLPGERVGLSFDPAEAYLFAADGAAIERGPPRQRDA
ncbi:ABC transporter ATP-binding protein [Acuticoccus sp.]|uniref:ABC transporter ATP-binding protein n=1 Tax=Acuticoccus sp. TaxID=1904378 RepID=UPI003B51CDB9